MDKACKRTVAQPDAAQRERGLSRRCIGCVGLRNRRAGFRHFLALFHAGRGVMFRKRRGLRPAVMGTAGRQEDEQTQKESYEVPFHLKVLLQTQSEIMRPWIPSARPTP